MDPTERDSISEAGEASSDFSPTFQATKKFSLSPLKRPGRLNKVAPAHEKEEMIEESEPSSGKFADDPENKREEDMGETNEQLNESSITVYLEHGEVIKESYLFVCRQLLSASFLSGVGMLLNYASFFIGLVAAGKLNDADMENVLGVANVWISGFATFLIISLADALAIFCSRAYGFGDFQQVGDMLYKGYFLCFVVLSLSSGILLMNSYYIFKLFGYEEDISRNVSHFIKLLIPSLYCQGVYETTKGFLNAQGIFMVPMLIKAANLIWYIFFIEFVVVQRTKRVDEVALGMFCVEFVNAIMILCLIFFSKKYDRKTFVRFVPSRLCLNLKEYLKETVEIAGIWYIEVISTEVSSIMAGRMHNDFQLASFVSSVNIANFVSIGALGLSFSTRTYISNAIGEGSIRKMRLYSKCAYFICLSFIALEVFCFLVFRKEIISLFTHEEEIETLLGRILLFYMINIMNENLVQVHSTHLKGMGKEKQCLVISVISFIIVGLPLSYYLCFERKLYALGIWFGLISADSLCNLLLGICLLLVNWEKGIHEVKENLREAFDVSLQPTSEKINHKNSLMDSSLQPTAFLTSS